MGHPLVYTLTHISLPSFCGTWANSADPDQTPQRLLKTQFNSSFMTYNEERLLKVASLRIQ